MNKRSLKIFATIIAMFGYCSFAYSQWRIPPTSTDSTQAKRDYHLVLRTGVVSSELFSTSYVSVSPSVSFNITPKTTLNMGFSVLSTMGLHGIEIGKHDSDLAPRKETNLVSGKISATYKNENLLVRGSIYYLTGTAPTIFQCKKNTDLNSFGGSLSLAYKTDNDNILTLNVAVIKSNVNYPLMYMYNNVYSPFSLFDDCYNSFLTY